MKTIEFGNILEANNGIIVHGCNAQGVMGSGIALSLRNKWPIVFTRYAEGIKKHKSFGYKSLGQVIIAEIKPNLLVFNAITQQDFGRDPHQCYVSYQAIQQVFNFIVGYADVYKLPVHYPLIGAGLANGNWSIISSIIDTEFAKHPEVKHSLWIYEP